MEPGWISVVMRPPSLAAYQWVQSLPSPFDSIS